MRGKRRKLYRNFNRCICVKVFILFLNFWFRLVVFYLIMNEICKIFWIFLLVFRGLVYGLGVYILFIYNFYDFFDKLFNIWFLFFYL